MKKLLVFITFLSFLNLVAQDKIPYIDYEDIAKNIDKLAPDKKYKEIVEELNKISTNDSVYDEILILKSYYLLQDKDYDGVLETVNEGLKNKYSESRYSFFVNKGVALLGKEDYKQTIEVYNEAIKEFPKNHLLFYNRALAYEYLKQYDQAIKDYQQSIVLNPFYAKSHLQLGKLCYQNHKISQSLMAITMYLLLDPDGENSFSVLSSMNTSVSRKNDLEPLEIVTSVDDDAFADIDLILENGIALNKNYKIDNKIKIPLIKQSHALMEQLEDFEGEGGFWDQKYVPFYQWIYNEGHFDAFAYTISYTIKNETYKKVIEKNVPVIENFLGKFYDKWMEIVRENEQLFEGKNQKVVSVYSDNTIQAQGKAKNGKKIGYWEVYGTNGSLKGKGSFDQDGNKTGEWVWYDTVGRITERENYLGGKLEGKYTSYHSNKKINAEFFYKNDTLEGPYKRFNERGALVEKKVFLKGKLNGEYESFHSVGKKARDYHLFYKDGKIDGELKRYYADGGLYDHAIYKEGKLTDTEKLYYPDGKLFAEYQYEDGLLEGVYKTYHPNGKPLKEGMAKEGFFEGDWKIYYSNGKIQEEIFYEKGNPEGVYKQYGKEGNLFEEFLYKNGLVVAYKYFNEKGEIIEEASKKRGEFYFKGFSALGSKQSEGLYDIKGGKKGEWNYYDDGVLINKSTYKNNTLHGKEYQYFKNGSLKAVTEYRNDSIVGYYSENFKNEKLSHQGWYKNGNAHGTWLFYYKDGTLKDKRFYHQDQLHGEQKYYGVEGKLFRTRVYEYGELISEKFYNPDGTIFETIDLIQDQPSSTITTKHFNGNTLSSQEYVNGVEHGLYKRYNFSGKLVSEGNYVNGEQHGPWIWYHDNGNVKRKGTYLFGELDGKWEEFYENGQLDNKSLYRLGDLQGIYESYSEDGVLIRTIQYLDGEMHGERRFFSPEGKLQLVRYYYDGKIIGYSHHDKNGELVPMIPIKDQTGKIEAFYDNGTVSVSMEIKNGDFVNNYKTYYYNNGQICKDINYKDDQYHGSLTYYYSDGKIKREGNYEYGNLQGVFKKYYPNGKLKEEIFYKNGSKSGTAKYYNIEEKLIKEKKYFNGLPTEETNY